MAPFDLDGAAAARTAKPAPPHIIKEPPDGRFMLHEQVFESREVVRAGASHPTRFVVDDPRLRGARRRWHSDGNDPHLHGTFSETSEGPNSLQRIRRISEHEDSATWHTFPSGGK